MALWMLNCRSTNMDAGCVVLQGITMEHRLPAAGSGSGDVPAGMAQLSGGQRTLLSLALILAVRCFDCCAISLLSVPSSPRHLT